MRILLALTILTLNFAFSHPCDELVMNQNLGSPLSKSAILHKGRIKPLAVASTETLKQLTEKSSWQGESALSVFCKLSVANLMGVESGLRLGVKLHHEKVLKLVKDQGVELENQTLYFDQMGSLVQPLRFTYQGQKLNDSYKKALAKLITRYQFHEELIQGSTWSFAVSADKELRWHTLSELRSGSDELMQMSDLENYLVDSNKNYETLKTNLGITNFNDSLYWENILTSFNPFTYALFLSPLLLIFMWVNRSFKLSMIFAGSLLLLEIAGIFMRVMISGRAPITNMYETVMFSGFGATVIAFFLALRKKDLVFLTAALSYNTLCLFMMRFSGGMLNESISPLVPVLRDNFWLSTHVTTVILSYAAFALAWILANIFLVKKRFMNLDKKEATHYFNVTYTSIKVGVVLLSAGIILGGIWADYSWGRFWGWDPKETWSLIVLLYYMAVLHGRYTQWINRDRFMTLMSLGFLTVMMAWFGVNYILAAGLHSYGFSEGGAIFLGTFFLLQIVLVAVCTLGPTSQAELKA